MRQREEAKRQQKLEREKEEKRVRELKRLEVCCDPAPTRRMAF